MTDRAKYTTDILAVETLLAAGAIMFPCRPDTKSPAVPRGTSWKDHELTKADAEKALKAGQPLGIRPSSVGAAVVDVDATVAVRGRKAAVAGVVEPAARMVRALLGEPGAEYRTRGGGLHLIYSDPDGACRNALWAFGETRGADGYVVAWDLPAWARAVESGELGPEYDARALTPLPRAIRDAVAPLALAVDGERNETLNRCAFQVAKAKWWGPNIRAVLTACGLHVGLDPDEIERTLDSAQRGAKAKAAETPRTAPARQDAADGGRRAEIHPDWRVDMAPVCEALGIVQRINIRAGERHEKLTEAGWTPRTDADQAKWRLAAARKFVTVGRKGEPATFAPSPTAWNDALCADATRRMEDPFLSWLDALPEWDGQPRSWLGGCFPSLAGDPLATWASKAFLAAACRRADRPGASFPLMLVLIGEQGVGKTLALSKWFPAEREAEWFCGDASFGLDAKQLCEAQTGKVLMEFAEIGAKDAPASEIKVAISKTDDGSRRLAWRRDPVPSPRRTVWAATTNDPTCLPEDRSGHRRFVVLTAGEQGEAGAAERVIGWWEANREQAWAEALDLARGGFDLRVPAELRTAHAEAADVHAAHDDRADSVAERFLAQYTKFDDAGRILSGDLLEWLDSTDTRISNERLGKAMYAAGYERDRPRIAGKKTSMWVPRRGS